MHIFYRAFHGQACWLPLAHTYTAASTLPDRVLKSGPILLEKGVGRNIIQSALFPNRLESIGEMRHIPREEEETTALRTAQVPQLCTNCQPCKCPSRLLSQSKNT